MRAKPSPQLNLEFGPLFIPYILPGSKITPNFPGKYCIVDLCGEWPKKYQ